MASLSPNFIVVTHSCSFKKNKVNGEFPLQFPIAYHGQKNLKRTIKAVRGCYRVVLAKVVPLYLILVVTIFGLLGDHPMLQLAVLIFQISYIINYFDVLVNKFILAVKTQNKRICSQNLSLSKNILRTRLFRNHKVIIFTLEIHFTRLYLANVSMESILALLNGAQGLGC